MPASLAKQFRLLGILSFAWVVVTILSGLGFSIGKWDFANPSGFGSALGGLGAIFSAFALIVTLNTLKQQQDQLNLSNNRELALDAASFRRDFEQTYFGLLRAFEAIVSQTDVPSIVDPEGKGRDAFKNLLRKYRTRRQQNAEYPADSYQEIYNTYRNDLGHYFRFLYHIVRFVHESDRLNKLFYIRFLRASLSEAELCLLALNCEYGEGRAKFKNLVELYSILHNISQEAREEFGLDQIYGPQAFGETG